MVLRSLLGLAGIMLLSILVIVPARAADDEREKFTISGTVWIDENRDSDSAAIRAGAAWRQGGNG